MAGYPDWRRVQDFDGPALYSDSFLLVGGGILTSVFDVSRFAYLAGYDSATNGDITAAITWYTDPAGVNSCGVRYINLSSQLAIGAQYRLPNLGPYVRIRWDQISAVAARHSSQIFPTNRWHPLEIIPQHHTLMIVEGVVVPNGTTSFLMPSDYYAGPIKVGYFANGQTTFKIQVLGSDDVWRDYQLIQAVPVNSEQIYDRVVPPGAWRVAVQNTAGFDLSVYCRIIYPSTGST